MKLSFKVLFILCVLISLLSACKNSDPIDPDDPQDEVPNALANATYYFTANVDGDSVSMLVTRNKGGFGVGHSSSIGDSCIISYESTIYESANIFDSDKLQISFTNGFARDCFYELEDFDIYFSPRGFPYTEGDVDDPNVKGVEIRLYLGDKYYTSLGATQPATANFDLASVEDVDEQGFQVALLEGTFSCVLVNDDDPSDLISLTNARYKLIVSSYQAE